MGGWFLKKLLLVYICVGVKVVCEHLFSTFLTLKLETGSLKNSNAPLYAPQLCPENQLLYSGVHKEEWTCDCGPGFLYYEPKNGCFKAYRRGPCRKGQYLILEYNTTSPSCSENPCDDGYVRYAGKCYAIGKANGPCVPISQGGGILDVNVTTLKIECLTGTNTLSLFNFPNRCFPGSKRDRNGNCRVVYND